VDEARRVVVLNMNTVGGSGCLPAWSLYRSCRSGSEAGWRPL